MTLTTILRALRYLIDAVLRALAYSNPDGLYVRSFDSPIVPLSVLLSDPPTAFERTLFEDLELLETIACAETSECAKHNPDTDETLQFSVVESADSYVVILSCSELIGIDENYLNKRKDTEKMYYVHRNFPVDTETKVWYSTSGSRTRTQAPATPLIRATGWQLRELRSALLWPPLPIDG